MEILFIVGFISILGLGGLALIWNELNYRKEMKKIREKEKMKTPYCKWNKKTMILSFYKQGSTYTELSSWAFEIGKWGSDNNVNMGPPEWSVENGYIDFKFENEEDAALAKLTWS